MPNYLYPNPLPSATPPTFLAPITIPMFPPPCLDHAIPSYPFP